MSKLVGILLIGCLLIGCSNNEPLSGSEPPEARIQIGDTSYETVLGTYCWDGIGESTCVDTAGPKELLAGKEPIKVKSGDVITFIMDYEPKPNEFHVMQISDNGEQEIKVENNWFTAPKEKGIYYYSYGVWWMDEEQEHVSHGDAFYNFVLEVID